jgi:hypothetical protein
MKKIISLIYLLIISSYLFGQDDSVQTNLSDLELSNNYELKTTFSTDKDDTHLIYQLVFDDKGSWDEEIRHLIYLHISKIELKAYDLSNDIQYKYYQQDGAITSKIESQDISGHIRPQKISDDSITAELRLIMVLKGHRYIINGVKEFKRK